jgi:hypothetical protein
MQNHLSNVFYGLSNADRFFGALQSVINSVTSHRIFAADNLFTFDKNLSFLSDEKFMEAFGTHVDTEIEKAIVWRIYTLCWAAKRALRLDGDFMECGSHRGTSARIIADYLDFASVPKRFRLFDVFDNEGQTDLHGYPDLKGGIYDFVRDRFSDFPNVDVIRGWVPGILEGNTPDKIAFLHIDMNNATAELAALEHLFDRVVPGGSIVLDDYGWAAYSAQKEVEDAFFESRGYQVLELPTGQGLVIA